MDELFGIGSNLYFWRVVTLLGRLGD